MTELVKFRCNDCGYRFEVPILTDKEKQEVTQDNRPVFNIQCLRCKGVRVQKA